MKRAKVSQALFAKVAASKSQVLSFLCKSNKKVTDPKNIHIATIFFRSIKCSHLAFMMTPPKVVCVEESPDNQAAAVLCRALSSVHQTAIVS